MAFGHSKNASGIRHDLVDHLRGVAKLAEEFAKDLGRPKVAYYVGLWHDLGKFHPDFQDYLLRSEADPTGRGHGPDHKAAGAWHAAQNRSLHPLSLLVRGHHGGLKSLVDSTTWVTNEAKKPAVAESLRLAREQIPDLDSPDDLGPPDHARTDRLAGEFWLRMMFSALVDADYLDTEAHFSADRTGSRNSPATIAELWQRFSADHSRFADQPDTPVNVVRREIYQDCVEAAKQPPGIFRLTVPTGGGKTHSGLAFGLKHALEHGQERIIVAVPFISITQQTADVYREIFAGSGGDSPIVLEHHSMAGDAEGEDFHHQQVWARLASENWDAPIVVTTTVQLFESLFSNMPSHTRKLHRLANSVIVLDEAQSAPAHLLAPVLDGLRELTEHYRTTVVLSTATQPAFEVIKEFNELPAQEIVPDPGRHFQSLSRVGYQWTHDTPMSWVEIAGRMRQEKQSLCVLNTRADALSVLDEFEPPDALHLSTWLCGSHRRSVISEVKRRLESGDICHLVSTQVIEAGVDLDFPLVMRAIAPLDSIVQSAGRCNREGKVDRGTTIIFSTVDDRSPAGFYKTATGITRAMLQRGPIDIDQPGTLSEYFQLLYATLDTDREGIQELRKHLDYPAVADRFRMIAEDTVSAVITIYGDTNQRAAVAGHLHDLAGGVPNARHIMRRLQPYIVSINRRQVPALAQNGLLQEVITGVYEWRGAYDPIRGIGGAQGLAPELLIV